MPAGPMAAFFGSTGGPPSFRAVPLGRRSERTLGGSYKVYVGGRLISHAETPMAAVLSTGISVRGAQAEIERPDGSRVWAMVISPDRGR